MRMTRLNFLRGSTAMAFSLAHPFGLWAAFWRKGLDTPATTANYWCTWRTQSRGGDPAQGFREGRDAICEANLFGKGGWADSYFPEARRDLYLVLDDGWDVPFGKSATRNRSEFGSLEIDGRRFPSFKGTPGERLRQLNEAAKSRGWRGAGLWVACQSVGELWNRFHAEKNILDDWKRKLEWSASAGIEYWKIDWGAHANSAEFRALMYDLKEKYAPTVLLEHAECQTVVNGIVPTGDGEPLKGTFRAFGNANSEKSRQYAKTVLAKSDYFRTYDIMTSLMGTATTLDRCAFYLACGESIAAKSILSTEDELYLASGLGLAFGVMRGDWPHYRPKFEYRDEGHRLAEVTRATRWSRIAPAFGCNCGIVTQTSDELKSESFLMEPDSHWYKAGWNKVVTQRAPERMSRGLPLPHVSVSQGEKPFVVASRNPNGAVAVAALPSVDANRRETINPAKVDLDIRLDAGAPLGAFGRFEELSCLCENGCRIQAQDLAGGPVHDVTGFARFDAGRVHLPGDLLAKIGKETDRDQSHPATLLFAERKEARTLL